MTTAEAQPTSVLRQLIDERGILHRFLADRAGITRSHFTRILNRERPATQHFIDVIAAQLGVEPSAFANGVELLPRPEAASISGTEASS